MKKLIILIAFTLVAFTANAQTYHYDVNNDGVVSITDVTFLVNNILGIANVGEGEQSYTYDVNGDGSVNVTDVTCLVNKILGVLNPGELPPSYLTCPDDYHPHLIDLGLPSGVLWSCCNVGADKPEACGGYYAWGETEEQEDYSYSWASYAYGRSENDCDDLGSDIAGTRYDVAHVKWGGSWVMPSQELQDELRDNCTYEWTTENGVKGGKFTSKTNGGTIFLPAEGYRRDNYLCYPGSTGYYWSSTQELWDLGGAMDMHFRGGFASMIGSDRCEGLTVRPVSIIAANLLLSSETLSLHMGATGTVEITSGRGDYAVSSSDEGIATAVVERSQITVTATGAGTATITVRDTKSGQEATIVVSVSPCPDDNHPHMIDLGLPSGILWSCCNVGADKPEAYGGYYAWGETEEKSIYSHENYIHSNGIEETCHYLGSDIAGTQYDVAHIKWGGSWVMPSKEQQDELRDNCTYEWATVNGVEGGKFTSRTNGGTIFLPAAGERWKYSLNYAGSEGRCWSSTPQLIQGVEASDNAYFLYFDLDGAGASFGYYSRFHGNTVRPVFANLLLSSETLSLHMGATGTVEVTCGLGDYAVSSSDEGVATAVVEGYQITVTATGAGGATITVRDTKSGQEATIVVTVSPCPDDHHPHMIDLGLPSGVLWSCCNVGSDKPEAYGGYYAWGETEEKSIYDWSTYVHCDGSVGTCHDLGSDIAGTLYDVAHVKWGGSWVMPSKEQQDELRNNCTYEWTTVNGVEGAKFTSRTNGFTIFLPAVGGYYVGSSLYGDGSFGNYWSSTQDPSYSGYAYNLAVGSSSAYWGNGDHGSGYAVRPVSTIAANLLLSSETLRLLLGATGTVEVTSGRGAYAVSSSDEGVATAVLEGSQIMVTATGAGTATITVRDTKSGQEATFVVIVVSCPDDHHPHMIDLGLPSGVLWSCCNVGADKPEAYGGYYAWGETEEKSIYDWSTYVHCDGEFNTCHDIGSDIAGTRYDVAHVKWGGSWVMPSKEQQDELIDNCTYEWATVNGVNGGWFISRINGGTIFLPAAGYYDGGSLISPGYHGCYYSSTQYPSLSHSAYGLYLSSGSALLDGYNRNFGRTVRPVFAISLSSKTLRLLLGATGTVEVTSGLGDYAVSSSDEGVATAVVEGSQITVTATGFGTATITVTDTKSGREAAIVVTVSPCPDDNHPHMIDLGLPSGVLWSCCNVGADNPEAYGGYYAWGETEEKSIYDWSTYVHCDGSPETCHDLGSDIAGTRYDVAHVKWGGSWVMPSKAQQDELISNCTYEWATVNGVNGGWFTSRTNGGTIFLPAASFYVDGNLISPGGYGCYHSSTKIPSESQSAYGLFLKSGSASLDCTPRRYGCTVRPVFDASLFLLSSETLSLHMGATGTVEVTSGLGDYAVSSSDEGVATAVVEGSQITVTATGAGDATITVRDMKGGREATIVVTVSPCPDDHHPHMIDLGLPSGVLWSCCNVGADKPEANGGYYAWGETEEKEAYNWSTYKWCNGSNTTMTKYCTASDYGTVDGKTVLDPEDDVAHVKWGGDWRMPTREEQDELFNECTYEGTSLNGVNGKKFTGPNGNSLFLPAAGYYWDDSLHNGGNSGYYWSSTQDPSVSYDACRLLFRSGDAYWVSYINRFYGLTVRPVSR